jgi:hypothetical protein
MMRFDRPAQPANFETKVKKAKKDVQEIVDRGDNPKSEEFAGVWKDFKGPFSAAQYHKCGYCELEVIAGQNGDVEHYAPKAQVSLINQRGNETDHLANISGRTQTILSEKGYWWLAYHWDNYLLACEVCNQKWKMNIYPCEDPCTWPPTEASPNQPLLLNPFGPDDPIDHLRFDRVGGISPKNNSVKGQTTIAVCGLDRLALTFRRSQYAQRIFVEAQDLVKALNSGNLAEAKKIAERLVDSGDIKKERCGMVRSITTDETHCSWAEIEALASI